MTVAYRKISTALEDIRAGRYRTITYTPDGTVIIADAETGKSASGRNIQEAQVNFRSQA